VDWHGQTHFARNWSKSRFFNVVDLDNKVDSVVRADRQGHTADLVAFLILDQLGYLPFTQTGGQLPFHLNSSLYERHPSL